MIPEGIERWAAEDVLAWTYATHSRVALVSSFQAESGVLIDMAARITEEPEVITIDTGRLPEETHRVFDVFRERYAIRLRVISPRETEIEAMVAEHGSMLFRSSSELRRLCCEVRKVRPLRRALRDYDAWVTGVRRDQTPERGSMPVVAPDPAHGGITKVAPLAAWSRHDVHEYLDTRHVPRHPLHARGFTSIGCAPCTRATQAGEGERAGRWWWERGETKECGLHTQRVIPEEEVA